MHKRTYIKHYMKIFSYEYIGLYKNIKHHIYVSINIYRKAITKQKGLPSNTRD